MEFEFEGRCVLSMEHKQGDTKSTHKKTDFNLDVSKNLKRSDYLDEDDLPTQNGTKALTLVFVHGLVGNIHHAHEKGYWDSAEHLRYIISELERGFATVAKTSKSNFKS